MYKHLILALIVAGGAAVNGQRNPCLGIADGMFVNDFNSCEGYFLCMNGVPNPAQCPVGFFFNEAQQLCDFQQNVFCHICNQQFGVQLLPHPTQCNKFITCSEGISFLGTCTEGSLFDRYLNACKHESRVDCVLHTCPLFDVPNVIVYLPGVQSCDEYFICQSGVPIQRFCAPGLHWNHMAQGCDFPQNVQCML